MKNSDGEKVYSFLRHFDNDEVLVIINFSRVLRSVDIDMTGWKSKDLKEFFTGDPAVIHDGKLKLEIGGLGCRVFIPGGPRSGVPQ